MTRTLPDFAAAAADMNRAVAALRSITTSTTKAEAIMRRLRSSLEEIRAIEEAQWQARRAALLPLSYSRFRRQRLQA